MASLALMVAANGGHVGVTKLLLDHGADVAAADNNGLTSLMVSTQCGHVAVAKLLVRKWCKLNRIALSCEGLLDLLGIVAKE